MAEYNLGKEKYHDVGHTKQKRKSHKKPQEITAPFLPKCAIISF